MFGNLDPFSAGAVLGGIGGLALGWLLHALKVAARRQA
jgi:hypothetical protein